MGVKNRDTKLSRSSIRNKAEKILTDLNILKIPTPYKSINLEEVVKKAVYYLPPFEEKHEKGFKDSIIAETIRDDFKNTQSEIIYIFICSDKKLFEYLNAIEPINGTNFKMFQSVPEFESDLRLILSKIDKGFIKNLAKQAETIFYDLVNPESSLFHKFEIKEKINQQFGHLFLNPERHQRFGGLLSSINAGSSLYQAWAPIEQTHFEISKPIFIKQDNDNYEWNSVIVSKQKFESTAKSAGWGLNSRNLLEHVLEFGVGWSFKLNSKGEIVNPDFGDIKNTSAKSYDVFEYPTKLSELEYRPSTSSSGATLSGIGTIPVGELDEPDYYDMWRDMEAEKRENESGK